MIILNYCTEISFNYVFFACHLGRGETHICYSYYLPEKTLPNYQKIERQAGKQYATATLLNVSSIFYITIQGHLLSSQPPLPLERALMGFKQRIVYINKNTINVCRKKKKKPTA